MAYLAIVVAPISGHTREAENVSTTGADRLRQLMCKMQSLYELEFKQSFVKAALSRAVRWSTRVSAQRALTSFGPKTS